MREQTLCMLGSSGRLPAVLWGGGVSFSAPGLFRRGGRVQNAV